ncbi:hypothetical protein KRP22_001687 [Phytophthora ramorum]|nr:Recoverin family protein [Phytophthora ramorum]
MTHKTARVSAVTLLLGDEARELLLCAGLALPELLQCVGAGFPALSGQEKTLVAVRHASSRVFFPLSLLCRSPEIFEGTAYHLVLDGEDATKCGKLRPRRKRRARDRREYEAVTTASDEEEQKEQPPAGEEELEMDLTDFELPQLVNVFTQACPTGALDRITFERCLEKILSQSGRYDPQARKMFTRLFNVFDARKEIVDVADFLGGVSVFACGERDEKIQLTFDLYDMDGDAFISKEEMTKYLTAVFLVIGETSPELFQQNKVDPAELGVVTASQCFAESTLNREGKLSYEAFREWYSKPGPTQFVAATRGKSEASKIRVNGMQATERLDLATLREVTGLSALSASDLFAIFSASATNKGGKKELLTRAEFKRCFYAVLERLNREPTREITKFLDRLFDAFDEDESDSVDFVELSSGLSVLCGGSNEDKVVAAFSLFDTDGDGFITQQEMEAYLTSVFNVMYETTPATRQSIGIDSKALAHYTTKQAFAESDVNQDGKLSLGEFRSWYWIYGNEYQQSAAGPPPASQRQPSVGAVQGLGTINFVASLTGLRDRAPSDVFEIIAAKVNEDGVLSRGAFFSIVDELVQERALTTKHKLSAEEKSQLQKIMESVFSGFDTDHDGFVDFCELSSGISVLCSGSQQEKVKSAFTLFDINQDGFISRDEMETYLASVYRIVFMTSPATVQQLHRISPEELARITTADAFTVADANHDGRLSFEEFTKWYSSQNLPQFPAQNQQQEQSAGTASHANGVPSSPRVSPLSSKGVLNEMKELTNLGAYDVNDIFEFFQASADRDGNVTQPVFFRCFNKLLAKDGRTSRETQVKTQQLLKELFELFDADKNGVVDVQELGAGLSILCGGSRSDKAKSMFTLYDVNHDGYISPEEMSSYLTSVFKVMFKASPELPAKTGMMPEQLAKITTRECFRAFDHNRDGQLSFDEFRVWFEQQNPHNQRPQTANGRRNSLPSAPAASPSSDSSEANTPGVISIEVAKKLSGLEGVSLDEVSELFASATGGGNRISRRIFDECFYKHICTKATPSLSVEESTRVHEVIDRLFTAFDTDQKGIVDFNELMSGLSILCGASTRDEKVLAAFKVYDTNGDGIISEDEMTHYLGSVFKLLYALDPTRQQQLGIPAETLASVTANEIFEVADVNHDGNLTFDEFQKWYSRPEQASFNDIVAPLDLNEVRQLTNLGNLDVVEVFERFAEHADEDGMLNRESFDKCFFEIIEMAHPRTQIEKLRAKMVADRLYDVFDRDGDGQIDFSELASGLSVLCKGARDAKVKAAFRLYDFNADGFISLDEMKRYLTSIFKVLYEVQPEMRQETGVSAEELGVVTAEQAFLEADSNHDGKLSYDEFLTWYNSPAQAGISSAVAKNAIVDSSLHWMPLNEIKQLTNLAQYEPEEVFEIFAGEADEDGLLSRDAFNESFRKVFAGQNSKGSRVSSPETQTKLQEVVDGLFDLFDRDNSGAVDFGELASGLSVLCGGTKDQKVEAAFSLFDFNGDGFISLDEMTRYLTSVFRVLFQVSPDTQALGVTPEELGEVTAQQAFAEADQDHDGQLTLKEFQHWYQQPGGIGEVAKNGEQLFSIAEARRLTNLQAFSPMEVFETLAECADEQGYVSREAFDDCFRKFIATNEGIKSEEYQRINPILNRLFELFDVDKNGMVDFSEMSSGLSVFCGGSSEEKIRAAFALYDYNADGFISMEEMTRYLTSVFRVLKEASPAALQQMNRESPEELGVRTAQQAFAEADLDHDGRLSFSEFRKWYTQSSAANMERLIQNNIPEWLSLREVRRLTNLGSFSAQQVLNTFAKFTSADGAMDKETFRQAFGHFKVESTTKQTDDRLQLLVDRIFDLFDRDNNGLVDFNELASGLSVLCGGSQTDKVRAAFNLYDVNHDGYISLGEMRLYLTSVFKVLFEVNPDSEAQMGVTPEELGEITAEQAFVEADHDRDGKLSFAEFSQWYMQPKRVGDLPIPAVLGEHEQQQQEQKQPEGVPDWVSLDVVKQMTNLEKYTADEVFEIFANRCSEDGTLSREAFEECFEQLVDEQYKNDEVNLTRLRLILNRLFVIFDEDHNGAVDFCELSSGLSVLCGGSREEKVRAAFSLYDLNQDGFISLDEMVRYLASVFKVLYETSPGTDEKLGVQPDELATITAEQCFLEADLNTDGKLSFDEFVTWYSKSSGFEAPAAGVSSILAQQKDGRQGVNGNTTENRSEGSLPPENNKGSRSHHSSSPAPESPRKTMWGAGKALNSSVMSTPPVSFPSDKIYGVTGSNGDALLSPNSASALNMNSSNMEHVRQLLKLDTYEVNDVLEIFAEAAPSGELTFAAFKKCFDQIIRLAGGHDLPEERQEADTMIRRLFRVFDTDNSNTVDFGELASGLSVLSGSSMDDKVRAAFQLYDINGDGYITQEEMINYMTSIFKVMYETTDSTKTKMGVSPDELARATAEQCFKEADLNGDNKLSFEEFKKWCTSGL